MKAYFRCQTCRKEFTRDNCNQAFIKCVCNNWAYQYLLPSDDAQSGDFESQSAENECSPMNANVNQMNENQKTLCLCAASVLIGMVLFPPFQFVVQGIRYNMGYSFILNPPIWEPPGATDGTVRFLSSVNVSLLSVQELVASLAIVCLWCLLGSRVQVTKRQ